MEPLTQFLIFCGAVLVFTVLLASAALVLYKFHAPRLAQWSFSFSEFWVTRQRFDYALFWMEQSFRLKPTDAAVLYKMGIIHQELGHPGQALDYFYLAQLQNPDNATYAYNIGVAEYDLGHYDVAISHWFTALQHAENVDIDVYYCMGAAYEALLDWRSAIEIYRQALDVDPQHEDCLFSLATCLLEAGELEDALAVASQYVEQYNKCQGYNLLALIHVENANIEQATEAVTAALGLEPSNPEALNNLAVLQTQQLGSSLGESITQLQGIESNDETTQLLSHYNLMVIQGLNGDYLDASVTLNELLQHPPDERVQPSIAAARHIIKHKLATVVED